jgi:hypothetical protein
MWTFRGLKIVQTRSRSDPRDSFARALDDLDRLSVGDDPNRRDRLSGHVDLEFGNDDVRSEVSEQFRRNNTIIWGSGDTASTLQPPDDVDTATEDVEVKGSVGPPTPPVAVGFWDPALKETRWTVLKKYARTCERSSAPARALADNPQNPSFACSSSPCSRSIGESSSG